MESDNGRVNYKLLLDNSSFSVEKESVVNMFSDMSRTAQSEGLKIDTAFSQAATNIGRALGGLVGAYSLTELSRKIMSVRGEFQQLEVAFETMLNSAEKANALMNQLVSTAATTPFGLQEVAGGAKQLLAYGVAADEVNDTLVRLGDIAAGLSIPLGDLVYLYGTTMVQGRMYAQDMRQFMGRGIPLAEELAKQFGVTKDKVSELVSQGKIGFPEVKKALTALTDAGGKFGGLMEKQSHTITGQISNIEDALDMMFNDLGKQSEGIINSGLAAVSFLIEHYKEFGTALLTVVAAYGEYKAALMAIAAFNSVVASQEASNASVREAAFTQALTQLQAINQVESAETAAVNTNTAAKNANVSAIEAEVSALLQEMQLKAGQAAVDSDIARKELLAAQQRVAIAEQNFALRQQEYMAAVRSGNMSQVAAARTNLETAAKEKQAAATALNAAQTNVETTAKAKEAAAIKLAAAQQAVDTARKTANTVATGAFVTITNLATSAVHKLNAALKANPFGFVLSAITLVIGALSVFKMESDEAADSMERFRDAANEERTKLEANKAILQSVNKESEVYKKAVNDLSQMAESHGVKLEVENGVIKDQEIALKDLSNAINKAAAAKVVAEEASKAHKAAIDAEKEAMDKVKEAAAEASFTREVTSSDGWVERYTEISQNIRNITESQWDYVSQIVMAHAKEIADAYAESGDAGVAAAQRTLDEVNKYLTLLNVSDVELQTFQGFLVDYINTSSEAFTTAYKDLSRVEKQMQGVINATDDFKRSVEDLKASASDSYQELQRKQEAIQRKIEEINNTPMVPQVKDEQLLYLRGLLQEINGLMDKAKGGSLDAASEALDAARKRLKAAAEGTQEWKDAKADYDKKQKEYDRMNKAAFGSSKSSSSPKTRTTKSTGAKTDPKQIAYEIKELEKRLNEEREDMERDLREAFAAGVTSGMEDGTKKAIQQIEDNTNNQLRALDESIEKLRDKQAEADKQIWLKQHPNKKEYEYKTPAELEITEFLKKYPSLLAEYTKRKEQIERAGEEAKSKIADDQARKESESMAAYLEQYGSYYNKRQSIIAQYNKKIADAEEKGLKGEVLSLKKQLSAALGDLDFKEIEKALGGLFSEDISSIPVENLKEFKETLSSLADKSKDLSPEQLQQIASILGDLQTQIDLSSPIKSIKQAQKEYKEAKEEYETYMKAVRKARREGNFEAEAAAVKGAAEAQKKMNNAEQKAKVSTGKLVDVVEEFSNTLDSAGNTIGGVTGEMLSLAASGLGAGVAMANGMKMFKEAADNASKTVAILAIIQAAFQAVMTLVEMFGGKEDKTLTTYVEAMDRYISMLSESISTLKDEMSDVKNSMEETINKYKELVSLQEKSAEALKAQSIQWLNSGASYKSHSEGVKIRKEITEGLNSSSREVRRFYNEAVGQLNEYYKKVHGFYASSVDDFGRLDWLWSLSDADLKELAKNSQLLSALGDELSSAIIEYAESLKSIEDTLNEQYASLLSVSYDDFYNDFIEMVSDMDQTSADFANKFGEYMRKALIQNLVASQFKDRIKKLYETAGKAAESGSLEEELAGLREEWAQIAKEAREQVKLINDISGTNGADEDSSSGSWSALGEETGRALEGRMTAIHIQTTLIAEMMYTQGEKMTQMQSLSLQEFSILTEMSNLVFISTNHLERIARNSDALPSINNKLEKIRQNTDRL